MVLSGNFRLNITFRNIILSYVFDKFYFQFFIQVERFIYKLISLLIHIRKSEKKEYIEMFYYIVALFSFSSNPFVFLKINNDVLFADNFHCV